MATQQAIHHIDNKDKRNELTNVLGIWENRLKLREITIWLPHVLSLAVLAGIGLAVLARVIPLLTQNQLIQIAFVLLLLAVVGMILIVWYRPRPSVKLARFFDLEFKLKERISTALELVQGNIETHPEIAEHQIADAYEAAQEIDPRLEMPFEFRWQAWLVAAILLLVFAVLLLLPNPQTENLQPSADQVAIEAAADELRDITEVVATDRALDNEDRETLLDTLEVSLDTLEEENTTIEDAFAALSDAETELRDVAESFDQSLADQQSALDAAAESLNNQPNDSGGQNDETSTVAPSFEESLEETQTDLESLSEEEVQALADALEQAAEELRETNPELADALERAAEALRNGDMDAAQQALEEAANELNQQQQQMQDQAQSAENLQDAADQAQDAAEQLAQQEQQQQGEQPSQDEQSGEQSQSGNQPSDQLSDQQGDQGAPQPSNDGQPADSGIQLPAEGSSPLPVDAEQSDSTSQTSGDGEATSRTETTAPSSAGEQPDQNNSPDGEGESQYEEVYAPRSIEGGGDNTIFLESEDESDVPSVEGDFTENPIGESTVSYDTVFSDYAAAANRALESDYVPLGLRDVVRDYFTSLQPEN